MVDKAPTLEHIRAIQGQVVMVNFHSPDEVYQCELKLEDGSYLRCTFDESLAEHFQHALRQMVYAMGFVSEEATASFQIEDLIPITAQTTPEQLQKAFQEFNDHHDLAGSLRQALLEVNQGKLHPIETLWDDIEAE